MTNCQAISENCVEFTGITKLPFPEITNDKICTVDFLDAARDLVRIIEKFGKLFAPVKYDMLGNIEKLTTTYNLNKEAHQTLQDMILLEKECGKSIFATDALMWLRRGLHLILLFFEKIVEDHKAGRATEDLVAFLKQSYKESLEPYHGWMAQQLFGLLARLVPTRTQLLQELVNGEAIKNELILKDIEVYLVNLRKNVTALQMFYEEHALENNAVV